MPVDAECHMIQASFKFPQIQTVSIPSISRVSPPNVFTSESTCVIDRVTRLGEGFPVRCVFAQKSHIEVGANGWGCHYSGSFRPFILPRVVEPLEPRTRTAEKKSPVHEVGSMDQRKVQEETQFSDISESSLDDAQIPVLQTDNESETLYISDDERPDDPSFWFSDDEIEAPPKKQSVSNPPALPITSRPRILSSQHDTVTQMVAPIIDEEKYALIVNTLEAIVTVRWKQSEQTSELWSKFNKARTLTKNSGRKALVASCSSSLTLYAV